MDIIANEVPFNNAYSVADSVGLHLKRKEVRIIEVKASKKDFIRDIKLNGDKTSYYYHSHYAYIMCPTDIISIQELPHGYGLLYVDDYDNVSVIKKPLKNTARLKTLFDTTLRRVCRCLTNTFLFHQQNRENKDETQGKFKRNANILFIATPCPNCRKHIKELIKKDVTKEVICEKCKTKVDLSKAKIREITGFNKKFIKKINELNKND